ncbi:uncharacterized protein OCT59_002795 [Rhizophagus irregularis]|uniref:uncharacterized protein n=1 Tax=Rhizophagus irregularis TaxID=588596 RepID=UPI00333451F4|nr:hypothetical protein OCT59_002795 [Rhizophagus irregularis]
MIQTIIHYEPRKNSVFVNIVIRERESYDPSLTIEFESIRKFFFGIEICANDAITINEFEFDIRTKFYEKTR